MLTAAQVYETLDAKRIELGLSQAEVGRRALQQADGSALQNIRRGSSPSIETLSKLCDALGLELYLGKPRVTEGSFFHLAEPKADSDPHRNTAINAGYVPLPWIDPDPGQGQPPVSFSLSWLDRSGLLPDNLACALGTLSNSSMPAAVRPLYVIDRAALRSGFDWWAIREKAETYAARVVFEGHSAIITSETDDTPPRLIQDTRTADIMLLGKVVWIGQRPTAK